MERPWYIHGSWDVARWMLRRDKGEARGEKNGGKMNLVKETEYQTAFAIGSGTTLGN